MALAVLRWPIDLGEALILRPADLAQLFRLPEGHSPFIEFVEVLGAILDGGGGTTTIYVDEMDMEKRDKAPEGLGEIGMVVSEAVVESGGRIGGQLRGRSRNAIDFIMSSADPIIINPVRAVSALVRRSVCIFKDAAADDYVYRFTFRKIPIPMMWKAETDMGDIQRVTAENTIPGSERFQPLKSAGEEYHFIGGAGE